MAVICRGEAVEVGDGVKLSVVRIALTCCSIGLLLWCNCGGFEVYVLVVPLWVPVLGCHGTVTTVGRDGLSVGYTVHGLMIVGKFLSRS